MRMSDTNCIWCIWNDPQRLRKRLEEVVISGSIEAIQTTASREESRRPKETYSHSDANAKPSAKIGMKNLEKVK